MTSIFGLIVSATFLNLACGKTKTHNLLERIMKNWVKFALITTTGIGLSHSAEATTCTQPGDWIPLICDAPLWTESRCQTQQTFIYNMATQCAPSACPQEVIDKIGGCYGILGSNHWLATQIEGRIYRCTCGCVGEETIFNGFEGDVTAGQLIQMNKSGSTDSLRLLGSTASDSQDYFPIKNVVHSKEKKNVYRITSAEGVVLNLTDAHPVVVLDKNTGEQMMKQARELTKEDRLINQWGQAVAIQNVEETKYDGDVVNFQTKTKDHLVFASGYKMGDNAFQDYLARHDARMLSRNDILAAIANAK